MLSSSVTHRTIRDTTMRPIKTIWGWKHTPKCFSPCSLEGSRSSSIIPKRLSPSWAGARWGGIRQVVSWVYNSNTAKQHRLITWWNCQPDFKKIPQPYKNPTDKRIAKRISEGKTCRGYDWWEINQVKNVSKKDNPHPCPIPYELARRIVASTTKPGDLVCDPFAGSGTVLKAAQDLGRKAIGFELDQIYADYANKILK